MKMTKYSFAKWVLAVALVLALAVPGFAVAESEVVGYDAVYSASNPIPEIVANTRPSVVRVIEAGATWDAKTRTTSEGDIGSGSGSYIRTAEDGEGGYILTNYHVVADGDTFRIQWLDDTEMKAELVGYDNGTDIAVLRFREDAPDNVTPLVMGDSEALQIGELVIAIGNPSPDNTVLFNTVTAGIVSGLQREKITAGNFTRSVSMIQTDAAINAGNSGGALLNSRGELVGIPTIRTDSSEFDGIGFCVPISTVEDLVDQIIATGKVTRPMLGIGVTDSDGPDEPMKNYPPIGVMVRQVMEGSSAEEQGVQLYDIITEIDGVRITCYDELIAEVGKHEVGDKVTLKVYRYYDKDGNNLSQYEEHEFEIELRAMES